MKLSLTVIMPALNEQDTIRAAIASVLAAFDRYAIHGSIVVVDDGSTDQTGRIADDIASVTERVSVIHHAHPMGIGASFVDGVRHATNEIVVMFPGDNENDPEDALRFLPLLEQVDIIVPFVQNAEVRSRFRRALSAAYRFIVSVSFGMRLHYMNGTVFYRACLLEGLRIHSRGFFYQTEILVRLIRKGYLFADVPVFLSAHLPERRSRAIRIRSLTRLAAEFAKLFADVCVRRREFMRSHANLHPCSVSARQYDAHKVVGDVARGG